MSALAQCTPGDPVLLPAESKQLAYNSLIDQSQFLLQDKLYLNAGIDPKKSCTLASVLAVDTTPGMQRVFWGNSPSIVIVGPEADTDQIFRVADCVARLHTTLVQLSIVILLIILHEYNLRPLPKRQCLNLPEVTHSEETGRGVREVTPLPQATSWLLSEASFVLEGKEEGTLDARGESPYDLSVITVSEDEEGRGEYGQSWDSGDESLVDEYVAFVTQFLILGPKQRKGDA